MALMCFELVLTKTITCFMLTTITAKMSPLFTDCVLATGGNVKDGSACCQFPFTYKNIQYYSCTVVENYGVSWCYTNMQDRIWGICGKSFKLNYYSFLF